MSNAYRSLISCNFSQMNMVEIWEFVDSNLWAQYLINKMKFKHQLWIGFHRRQQNW